MDGTTYDAEPIGWARSPWTDPADVPPGPRPDGPDVRIEVEPRFRPALAGLEHTARCMVVMWFDRADRDRLVQTSRTHPEWGLRGVFALRSPHRPNPIGVSTVELVEVDDEGLTVRGLDALDGTPVLDLKPA